MPNPTFVYQQIEPQVREILTGAVQPENVLINTEEVDNGRVFVKIVSPYFNGRSEREKQNIVWDALKAQLGEGSQAVSLVLPFGMDEL